VTVRSDKNLGYAGGNNLAFASAAPFEPEVVFVINPDVTFAGGSLRDASAEVLALGNAASGAKTLHRGKPLSGLGTMNPWTGAARELADADVEARSKALLFYPMGHFLALGSDTWRALGGLTDDYFLFCEELDLALRLVNSGGRIAALKSVQIEHEKGITTGAVEGVNTKSNLSYRHATRSRVILYRSHRNLKKYLVPMVASRLLWSIGILVRSGPASAIAVLAGLRDGLSWRKTKVD
jgi:GT2 family glycosyltransferase